jgi:hypothetical protein
MYIGVFFKFVLTHSNTIILKVLKFPPVGFCEQATYIFRGPCNFLFYLQSSSNLKKQNGTETMDQ